MDKNKKKILRGACCVCQTSVDCHTATPPLNNDHEDDSENAIYVLCNSHDSFGEHCMGSLTIPQAFWYE